jgi:hypothetical protein
MSTEQWANRLANSFTCSQIRETIDYNIHYNQPELARVNTIALVRRLRMLGVLQIRQESLEMARKIS